MISVQQMKPKQPPSELYADEEAARRRDEVIKRMLNTPPQPRRAPREPKKVKEKSAPKGTV